MSDIRGRCEMMSEAQVEAAVDLANRTNISPQEALSLIWSATKNEKADARRTVVDVIRHAETGEMSVNAALAVLKWIGVSTEAAHNMLEVAMDRYGVPTR